MFRDGCQYMDRKPVRLRDYPSPTLPLAVFKSSIIRLPLFTLFFLSPGAGYQGLVRHSHQSSINQF
jgi:hypothetical protein